MGEVADLFASLGVKIDGSAWAKGDALMKKAMGGLQDLDRMADKVASNSKAAKAAERAAALKDREVARAATATERAAARETRAKERASAAASRAIRGLERDEVRAATAQARAQARAEVPQKRANAARERAAAKAKQEQDASRAEFIASAGMGAAVGLGLGAVAAYMGERVVKSGIEFNATMEDSKDEVAGMLALTNKTHLADEIKNADMLVDNLRERAAKLPGTTQEYIQMLSMITQPIMDAKLGLKDLEDLTVQSVVAAKGLHVPWEVAARDIDQAIRGQFHSTDPFSGKVLGSIGYKGEEGRSRFNQLTQEKRAGEFKRALLQPQFTELGEAAGKSFHGRLSTLQDAWEYFQGALAKPLFGALGEQLERINGWLEENKEKVQAVAEQVGGALMVAFDLVGKAMGFLIEHGETVLEIVAGLTIAFTAMGIVAAAAWIAATWPILLAVAAIVAVTVGVIKLLKYPGGIRKAFIDAFDAIKRAVFAVGEAIKDALIAAFDAVLTYSGVKTLIDIINFFRGKSASAEHERMLQDATSMPKEEFRKKYPQLNPDEIETSLPAGPAPPSLGSSDESAGTTSMRAPAISGGRQPLAMNIDVGGISVTSNATDPVAVADATIKAFDERLGYHLRRTMDEVG